MGLPLLSAMELMQVDTSLLSEMKVTREMDFPKRYKAAGPDKLSLSFFKCGGKVLKSELIKLHISIWAGELIPQE